MSLEAPTQCVSLDREKQILLAEMSLAASKNQAKRVAKLERELIRINERIAYDHLAREIDYWPSSGSNSGT